MLLAEQITDLSRPDPFGEWLKPVRGGFPAGISEKIGLRLA
jgi:hypothetical protein